MKTIYLQQIVDVYESLWDEGRKTSSTDLECLLRLYENQNLDNLTIEKMIDEMEAMETIKNKANCTPPIPPFIFDQILGKWSKSFHDGFIYKKLFEHIQTLEKAMVGNELQSRLMKYSDQWITMVFGLLPINVIILELKYLNKIMELIQNCNSIKTAKCIQICIYHQKLILDSISSFEPNSKLLIPQKLDYDNY